MNSDDTLFGRIKNGVLALSGNNPSIRVDGGALVVSDGPIPVPIDYVGDAPVQDRMITCRLRRAACPVNRIVVTRPDGFITFAAFKWLHDLGIGLIQLDWDGSVIMATGPDGIDQPALRRTQALALTSDKGPMITREILRAKLQGQANVARALGSPDTADAIRAIGKGLESEADPVRLLAIEAMAASIYWPVWLSLPLRFARRYSVPEHWQTFGTRRSPLSGKPLKAATPGNALLNYLYGVLAGEMTIALAGIGLDPGMGVFHADRDRRASLAHDAMEVLRPYVDGWLAGWLPAANFAKRDFFEESDGAIRLTRPLTSHLAMTSVIWRPAAQAVAGWLAEALNPRANTKDRRMIGPPLPGLPAPRRAWQGLEAPVPRMCRECGTALNAKQRKFCSERCTVAFNAMATLPTTRSPLAQAKGAENAVDGNTAIAHKNSRHIALRREWDFLNTPGQGLSWASNTDKGIGLDRARLINWYVSSLSPRLTDIATSEIRRVTGLSPTYAKMIRTGYVPHPRHFPSLAALAGVSALIAA